MAITVKAGYYNSSFDDMYPIVISSSYTGSTGSEEPDGDCIFLFPMSNFKISFVNRSKNTPTVGGAREYSGGKRQIVAQGNIKVGPNNTQTATEEMGAILDFMYDYSLKQGSTKCYLFFRHLADEKWLPISWDSSGDQVNYLKGQFAKQDVQIIPAKLYHPQIAFREATLP